MQKRLQAVETVAENAPYEDLPFLNKENPSRPNGGASIRFSPVAGRGLIDEAAAMMFGQLSTAHGLAARVEGPEALSTTNVFRLETTGVVIVCLVYLNPSAPSHMRYAVRRLRRKIPNATIILGCWMKDIDPVTLEKTCERAQKPIWLPRRFGRSSQALHSGGRTTTQSVQRTK